MTRPKESERKDVRTLILNRAKALFLTDGYKRITIRRIAAEIGYTPGTIYLYFKNKEEILYELHNEGFKLLYKHKLNIANSGINSALKRLRAGGRMYISFALEHPDYYEVMFNMPEPRDYIKKLREAAKTTDNHTQVDFALKSYTFLKQSILECIEEGYIQAVDPDIATVTFWSFGHGLASLIIRKRIPYPYEASQELADKAIDFFMSMITMK
jgi:AcrR family transcriptional regulator